MPPHPMRPILTLALLAVTASAALAQPALGETEFPNSGAPEAQADFLTGLLLLHSFEYDDARDAFQRARALDPGFAMAAWGEAMTHNHPIWQRQDRDAGRAALAGVTGDGLTERESAYLATLDVLFGEGDKEERDDAYADAWRRLAEDHPDDLDAQTFYALALLGTAHEGRDFTTYMKAAAVLEDVFDRERPGTPARPTTSSTPTTTPSTPRSASARRSSTPTWRRPPATRSICRATFTWRSECGRRRRR